MSLFYQQMYFWYLLDVMDAPMVDPSQTVDPYPSIDFSEPPDASQGAVADSSLGGSILGDVLSGLGFDSPQPAGATPDVGQGASLPADTKQPSAPTAPAGTGSLSPDSGTGGWSPDGGAYGR